MAPQHSLPPGWSTPTRGKTTRGGFPDAARRAILQRDPRCMLALPGCDGPSRIADHRVNYPSAMALGWDDDQYNDPSNGQGVCSPCHTKKTGAEAAAGRAQRAAERRRLRGFDDRHPGILDP